MTDTISNPPVVYYKLTDHELSKSAYRAMAERCVQRGIRMLDSELPEWLGVLDLDIFDIASGASCVLAQLAQNDMEKFRDRLNGMLDDLQENADEEEDEPQLGYDQGLDVLYDDLKEQGSRFVMEYGAQYAWSAAHGFSISEYPFTVSDRLTGLSGWAPLTCEEHWAILQEAWMAAIRQRQLTILVVEPSNG